MMGDYISREAAIKEVYRFDGYLDDDLEWRLHYALKKLPAADVVEVVRCRKCYFRALDGADVPVCTGAMAYSYTPDDWFCADGKPKDGGQDDV